MMHGQARRAAIFAPFFMGQHKASPQGAHLGFTLLEMIVVIVITGIIGAMVAVFIRSPIQGYVDSARRAQLSDIADTALRRISRDLRMALPNSVRVAGTCNGSPTSTCYLEFLLTSGGGRYRAAVDNNGNGDPLDFGVVDSNSSFDVLGPRLSFSGGESIVVSNFGYGNADAYAAPDNNGNRALYNGAAGLQSNIAMTRTTPFPLVLASSSNRFQVVQYPMTYACNPAATEIRRYWGYAIAAAQPTPPTGGSEAQLASNVGACLFTYNPNSVQGRNGVVSLSIQLTTAQGGESVNLFQETHVSNSP